MSEKITLGEYKEAYFEVYKENRQKSFYLHLAIYILTNISALIINLLFTPKFLWVIFPIFFWGIGVTWNYLSAFLWIDNKLNQISNQAENRLIQKRKK